MFRGVESFSSDGLQVKGWLVWFLFSILVAFVLPLYWIINRSQIFQVAQFDWLALTVKNHYVSSSNKNHPRLQRIWRSYFRYEWTLYWECAWIAYKEEKIVFLYMTMTRRFISLLSITSLLAKQDMLVRKLLDCSLERSFSKANFFYRSLSLT